MDLESWTDGEVKSMGETIKKYGISDGAEEELIKITKKFVKICEDFEELNEEQKAENREKFHESQSNFFEVGALIANLLAKKDPVIPMQIEDPSTLGASAAKEEVLQKSKKKEKADEKIIWLPYIQFRKILNPVLELDGGAINSRTMSDMDHAINNAVERAKSFNFDIVGAEQAIMAIVHSKFDMVSKGIWEFQLAAMEPTIEAMQAFLEQRSAMIQQELGPVMPALEMGARRKQTVCIYCKSTAHTIYKCSQGFESLSILNKKQFLRREDRCENCFMKHPADICTAGPCWTCKTPHNSMLCPRNQKNH